MAERHQINSDEFEQWLHELSETDGWVHDYHPREALYDMWVEGYSAWEVVGILG